MKNKILFVDDEPAVLDGYRRMLHREFEMDTAIGGEQGLAAILDFGPYSIVISDMRMPGMSGSEFLAQVRKKTPDTVRMLLTGYSDIDAAIAAVNEGYIFRYLTKPCGKQALVAVIKLGMEQYRSIAIEKEIVRKFEVLEKCRSGAARICQCNKIAEDATPPDPSKIVDQLRQAIGTDQLQLYYQPQVESGSLTGAEALLRWNHPLRGLLPPCEFVPWAEESGLILPLGNWVLEAACKQITAWEKRFDLSRFTLAVNVSSVQLHQPDFVQQVLGVLDRTGANPNLLELELTEGMVIEDIEDAIGKMKVLKSHGLSLSLDDFGTGYSSLAHLKRLPLDRLKIDRSFLRDIQLDNASGAIVQAIVSLGRAMGLSVIAEGVETEEQLECLARLGCSSFQGFHFSKPLPLEEFERFLSR